MEAVKMVGWGSGGRREKARNIFHCDQGALVWTSKVREGEE